MLLQIPGAPELLIILLVMALLVGVPVVLVGVYLFVRFVSGGDESAEIAELKGRIEELEAEVAAGDEAASNEVSVEDQRANDDHRADDDQRADGDQRADEDGTADRGGDEK